MATMDELLAGLNEDLATYPLFAVDQTEHAGEIGRIRTNRKG